MNSHKVCEMEADQPRKRRRKTNKKELEFVAELQEQVVELQEQLRLAREKLERATPMLASVSGVNGQPGKSDQSGQTGQKGQAGQNGQPGQPGPSSGNAANSATNAPSGMDTSASGTSATDTASPMFVQKLDLEREMTYLCEEDMSLSEILQEIRTCADRRHELLDSGEPCDVVSLGIISHDEAQVRLDLYRNHLYAAHPLVEIAPSVSVESFMADQPFLFNTIMAISSMVAQRNFDRDTNLRLENHAVHKIVTEVMVAGTKTVEMLKSLILLSLWYNSPEFFKLRRYHILNCVAVTLLHDLGIVNRTTYAYNVNDRQLQRSGDDFSSLEYRLLILILYFSTVSICLILRRAIFVKWTPYVNECCTVLENTGDEKYRQLAMFLRLNHELERIHHIVHAPEAYDSKIRLSRYSLAEFQTNLAIIKSRLRPDDHLHRAYYYLVEAYLHQPILTGLQVNGASPDGCAHRLDAETLSAIAHCTASCLFAMDEFNQLLPGEIAGLPLFYCSRVIYTAGMLLRLRYFILSLPSHVEKELVPRYAIVVILKLHHHVGVASKNFPGNNFLKKMRLILILFIQTYVTQVMDLLKKTDDDMPASFRLGLLTHSNKRALAQMAVLLRKQGDLGNMITDDGQMAGPPLHLDLLSFAAAAFHKNDDEGDEKRDAKSPHTDMLSPAAQTPEVLRRILVTDPMRYSGAYDSRLPGDAINHSISSLKLYAFPTPPTYNNTNPRGSLGGGLFGQGDAATFPELEVANKDNSFFSIDDEFWSNLLSTNSNKFHFAQNEPAQNENMLFMN